MHNKQTWTTDSNWANRLSCQIEHLVRSMALDCLFWTNKTWVPGGNLQNVQKANKKFKVITESGPWCARLSRCGGGEGAARAAVDSVWSPTCLDCSPRSRVGAMGHTRCSSAMSAFTVVLCCSELFQVHQVKLVNQNAHRLLFLRYLVLKRL